MVKKVIINKNIFFKFLKQNKGMMKHMKIILASTSPRRKELMDLGGFDYEVLAGKIDETPDYSLSIEEQSKDIAYRKAKFP